MRQAPFFGSRCFGLLAVACGLYIGLLPGGFFFGFAGGLTLDLRGRQGFCGLLLCCAHPRFDAKEAPALGGSRGVFTA